MQVLQVFFLQDLQDLALNLASFALKMKLFLQELKNLARTCKKKLQDNFLARYDLNLARKLSCNFFLQVLARSVQDFSILAKRASFLVQDFQDLMQDLASLARKILATLAYFLQDDFYWEASLLCVYVLTVVAFL